MTSCEQNSEGVCYCTHDFYLGDDVATAPPLTQYERSRYRFARPAPRSRLGSGPQHGRAYQILENFVLNNADIRGYFPFIDRAKVAVSLKMRITRPDFIYQVHSNMCGPAAFTYALLQRDIPAYTKYVTELYDFGVSMLGTLRVSPSWNFRMAEKPPGFDPADWIAMGSLRDSANWLFDYVYNSPVEKLRGGTYEGTMAGWLRDAGFKNVVEEVHGLGANVLNIRLCNQYFNQRYTVLLLVNSQMLVPEKQSDWSLTSNHFVVLKRPIEISADSYVQTTVYTWGDDNFKIPHAEAKLSVSDFLENYYGFIAAKPY
jgi:hypothetical protein